jgi:hypothetical protein
MPGSWTVPVKAGAPPDTQAARVLCSLASSKSRWGGVASAARIGALDGGVVAGAPDGSTHAIVERNDVTDQPAAGEVTPWHETQCASRTGATSTSNTGGVDGGVRSTEQPVVTEAQSSARTKSDARVPDRAAFFRGITLSAFYGRPKPGMSEPEIAAYES